ncbi:hypothetical protein P7C70_g7925, partial [Phenoliferia sp. Uapishka_3]
MLRRGKGKSGAGSDSDSDSFPDIDTLLANFTLTKPTPSTSTSVPVPQTPSSSRSTNSRVAATPRINKPRSSPLLPSTPSTSTASSLPRQPIPSTPLAPSKSTSSLAAELFPTPPKSASRPLASLSNHNLNSYRDRQRSPSVISDSEPENYLRPEGRKVEKGKGKVGLEVKRKGKPRVSESFLIEDSEDERVREWETEQKKDTSAVSSFKLTDSGILSSDPSTPKPKPTSKPRAARRVTILIIDSSDSDSDSDELPATNTPRPKGKPAAHRVLKDEDTTISICDSDDEDQGGMGDVTVALEMGNSMTPKASGLGPMEKEKEKERERSFNESSSSLDPNDGVLSYEPPRSKKLSRLAPPLPTLLLATATPSPSSKLSKARIPAIDLTVSSDESDSEILVRLFLSLFLPRSRRIHCLLFELSSQNPPNDSSQSHAQPSYLLLLARPQLL